MAELWFQSMGIHQSTLCGQWFENAASVSLWLGGQAVETLGAGLGWSTG